MFRFKGQIPVASAVRPEVTEMAIIWPKLPGKNTMAIANRPPSQITTRVDPNELLEKSLCLGVGVRYFKYPYYSHAIAFSR